VQSSNPDVGALQKVTDQLNDFAASFYDTAATTPPSFESAYDGATTQTGELASSFFTTSDGSATANAFNLVVNPALVDGTSALKQASGTPIVAALTQTNQSLDAGGLSVTNQTYSGIADAIISTSSSNAATVASNATSSAATATALSTQLSGQVGVNLDDEMTNLIVLQNSYSASARVVTTVADMLSSLLEIGQS
jgi:flagellar hook-associated protein 1 FlgK